MSSKDELKIEGFSNFLGAISYILQTVEGLKKLQPNADIKDLETRIKLDLSNVPLMLRLIEGQIQNFLTEYILDHEFKNAGYEALLAEVDKTRQILNEYKFSDGEIRLKHLKSIEAIVNKGFKEIFETSALIKSSGGIKKVKLDLKEKIIILDYLGILKSLKAKMSTIGNLDKLVASLIDGDLTNTRKAINEVILPSKKNGGVKTFKTLNKVLELAKEVDFKELENKVKEDLDKIK
jgi:hypothetical protein